MRQIRKKSCWLLWLIVSPPALGAEFDFSRTPELLPQPINDSSSNGDPTISPNGLELIFTSNRPGTRGIFDLWTSRRASLSSEWGDPERLPEAINTPLAERWSKFSKDGLELYFSRAPQVLTATDRDMWVTRRESLSSPWQEPVALAALNTPNFSEAPGSLSGNGLELWFWSTRPAPCECLGFFVSRRDTKESLDWAVPEFEPLLFADQPSSGGLAGPSITGDGLTLFFHADIPGAVPPDGTSFSENDIWVATRETLDAPFANPRSLLMPIDTGAADLSPYISADSKSLWFYSFRSGGGPEIWQVNVAVPEPPAAVLACLSLVCLLVSRRK